MKKGSIKVLSHSFALLKQAVARLNVVFECEVANPTVGEVFDLKVVDNSRAGLKCTLDAPESPFLVFVARDHQEEEEEDDLEMEDDDDESFDF